MWPSPENRDLIFVTDSVPYVLAEAVRTYIHEVVTTSAMYISKQPFLRSTIGRVMRMKTSETRE